jgi:D-alanyl-D-alanine carboxypeptidase (penicillin-binding protein 5/6)
MYSDLLARPHTERRPARARRRLLVSLVCLLTVAAAILVWVERQHRPGDLGHLPWPISGEAGVIVGNRHIAGPGADEVVPIASVAKVMTAYVVLHDHPLLADEAGPTITVTAQEAAAYPDQVKAGESLVRVTAGERLSERQALEALLLPSADNVAWILARWDRGSHARFVTAMNSSARALGMTSTRYTDASGLDSETVSTVEDQLRLAVAAMALPALAAVVAEQTAVLPVVGEVRNYNGLLGSDGVVGLKTGSTSAAGGCLVFVSRRGDRTVYGAVLGQPGRGRAMLESAFAASHRLLVATG